MAQTATAPARSKGPLVWMDMDQKELDDAYDQLVYAPNRDQVHLRNVFNSERVRRRLVRKKFLAPDGERIRVTSSFGVAAFPDARSQDQLVADRVAAFDDGSTNAKGRG